MKRSLMLLVGSALVISPLPAEEKEDRPARSGPRGDGSFLRSLDRDGDGAISMEEAGEHWERLSRLDTEGNGKVTFQEIAAAVRTRMGQTGDTDDGDGEGGKGGRPRPGEWFERLDRNNDGKITQDEVPDALWERIGRLDADEDGVITREEMAAAGRMKGKPGRGEAGKGRPQGMGKGKAEGRAGGSGAGMGVEGIFSRYDKNKDGKLSEDEVSAELWSRLRRADTDADGLVSREELEKSYERRSRNAPSAPEAPKRPELEKNGDSD